MAVRGTTKFKSNKQESKVAKEIKGRTVIASGSLWGSKGDVRAENYLIECKTTEKDFYTLSLNTWNKIEKEAIKDNLRIPVMSIDLEDGNERVAVTKNDFFNDFEEVVTTHHTYKIRSVKNPYILAFKLPTEKFLKLCLMPWDYFLENEKSMYGGCN